MEWILFCRPPNLRSKNISQKREKNIPLLADIGRISIYARVVYYVTQLLVVRLSIVMRWDVCPWIILIVSEQTNRISSIALRCSHQP